ncbi:MAG TPA: family 1 glycosylhydrolase [Humibacter sp.]|nr:family 1 glycosylhydrolase [Humibacter sp.]
MSLPERHFPTDFLWGAATAAHQVEGNNVNTDWWVREHAQGTDVAEISGDAADSFHRYPEDIRLLAELGFTSYRFSIEWARIEPEAGFVSQASLLHYRRMIDACLGAGLTPMVTLHHFTNPRWFTAEGGWRRDDAPDRFARYTQSVLPILQDVEWVCTINEPNIVAMTRSEEGTDMTAAALPSPDARITAQLVTAHRRSREVLAQLGGVKSGWSIAGQAFHAAPGCEAEMRAYRYPREDVFLEAAAGDDFVGVQAYLRTFIGKNGPLPVPDGAETTLTGWEYFPAALEIAVRHAWELSGHTPIFVTENGVATADDSRRIDYTHDALAGLHRAMTDGVDVRGYLHWSALDNYEWGSYRPTFGLIGWDKDTFERTPKPSASWLGEIARTGALHR